MSKYIPKTNLEEIFISNQDKEWVWEYLSRNPNITMDLIENFHDKPWDWVFLSINPELTFEMVKNNPDKDWKWLWVSSRPYMTLDIITNNLEYNWNWEGISWNPNLTIEFIEKYPDKDWDWEGISNMSNLTIDFIDKYKHKDFVWSQVSKSINLNNIDLDKYPDIPWCWKIGFSHNETLTKDFIEKYITKDWNWCNLSRNKCCHDIAFIRKYQYKKWDWYILSQNISEKEKKNNYWLSWINPTSNSEIANYDKNNIQTLEYLLDNKPLESSQLIFKYYVSLNPNITNYFINKYNDIGWKWDLISDNEFYYYKKDSPYPYSTYRFQKAINNNKLIQKELLEKSWNPKRFIDWCIDITEIKQIL